MEKSEEVSAFISDFKFKMRVFGVLFREEKKKNTQALLSLEMTWESRNKLIENLTVEDYCEGPFDDKQNGIVSIWVFGKYVNDIKIYIKISMGRPNGSVLCISVHQAEHSFTSPFKNY